MANDIQDRIGQIMGSDTARELAGTAVSEALKALGQRSNGSGSGNGNGHRGLSGVRGLAAGAGAAAVAPVAAKGIGKLIRGNAISEAASAPKKLAEGAASKLGDNVGDKVTGKIDEAGGPSGILKDTVKSALPFGGGGGGKSGGGKQDAEGVGKGRRMPIQQKWDIALPIETVYNQWTQFEDWPKFMQRVTRVTQEDPCKVSFAVKIWGKTKEFTADIETQRPDDRIKWKTSQGMNHTGVVTFRELGPNMTRVMLSFDLDPGGLLEKYARGARFVKRAARADLHRFVAFIEMLEHETGAWRGVIEDGEVVEDHDPSYDEEREYGSADELVHGRGSDEDDDEDSDEEEDEDKPDKGRGSRGRQAQRRGTRASSRSSTSRTASGRSSSGRSSSGKSSSGRNTSGRSSSGRSSSGKSSSGRSSSGKSASGRSSSGKSASGRSSSGKSASGRSSSGKSSNGRSSSGKSSNGRSSSGSSSSRGRGTTSSRSSSSSGSSSGRGQSKSSGGRSRSAGSSRSSRSSSHEGRQRGRSSRRS